MRYAIIGPAAAAVIVSGCGGSDGASSPSTESPPSESVAPAETQAATAEDSAAPEETAEAAAAGEVPDPCAVLTGDEIAAILGSDVGPGEVGTYDPTLRKVCTFTGLTLGVEVAADYDGSIQAAQEAGFEGEETSGVGERAYLTDFGKSGGGVISLIAVQGDYMVDLSGAVAEDQAKQLVQAMLDNLG